MPNILTTLFPDGTAARKEWTRPPTLEELQSMCGGYIEIIPHFSLFQKKSCVAIGNSEGKVMHLPFNENATSHWYASIGRHPGDVLVGNIVIATGSTSFLRRFP